MIVCYYGIYDTKAEECIRMLPSKNDETAARAVKYIVREKGFDRIAGRDYVLEHLFDIDTDSRKIVDNDVHVVASFGSELADLEVEEKQAQLLAAIQQPQPELKEEKINNE